MKIDIQIPYTTNPRMQRNFGDIYTKNRNPKYYSQKLAELQELDTDLYAETQESRTNFLIEKSCKILDLPLQHNIKDFALLFDEDVAILHNGILSAVCFCFPSSWVPAEKIGLSLNQIHKPVADNEKLLAAGDKLSNTISNQDLGSFYRQVWTVTNNSALSNHPKRHSSIIPSTINDLFFRLETQTTLPFNNNQSALFFVKVEVLPLVDIWSHYGVKIKSSIDSMTDSMLDYKNLRNIKQILNSVFIL